MATVSSDVVSLESNMDKVSNDEVIQKINSSQETQTISASKININGVVTANNHFKINLDGTMEAKGGQIGGWYLYNNGLYRCSYYVTSSVTYCVALFIQSGDLNYQLGRPFIAYYKCGFSSSAPFTLNSDGYTITPKSGKTMLDCANYIRTNAVGISYLNADELSISTGDFTRSTGASIYAVRAQNGSDTGELEPGLVELYSGYPRTDTEHKTSGLKGMFGINSAGTRFGIWSETMQRWLIRHDTGYGSNKVYLNNMDFTSVNSARTALGLNDDVTTVSGSSKSCATGKNVLLCDTGSLTTGHWMIVCMAQFDANASGRRSIFLSDSSATEGATHVDRFARIQVAPSPAGGTWVQLSYMANITTAKTLYLMGYQDSGATLNISSSGIRMYRFRIA